MLYLFHTLFHCYKHTDHDSSLSIKVSSVLRFPRFHICFAFFSNLIVTTTTDYCVVCCFAVFGSHQFHSFAPMQCYLFCFFLRRSFLFRSSPFLLVDDVLTLLFFCVCVHIGCDLISLTTVY